MNIFNQGMSILSKITMAGGGFYTLWGIIQFALSFKDSNGPGVKEGILTIVSGAGIILAGALFVLVKV